MTDAEIITEALNVIDAYINNGAPLPPKPNPYWRADAAIETIRSRLAALDRLSVPPGESARELAVEILDDDLVCKRMWTAWQYGTMTDEDFSLAREDKNRVADTVALIESSWAQVREECAQFIEIASLGDEYGSCFNPNKPGCAAILADAIRDLAQPKEAGA